MTYKYINTEYLESVTGGDLEIMREIIGMFRDQVIEFHREMTAFLEKNDFNSLGLLAHKAKSSVAIMGMNELATILKTLELDAKAGKDPENYPVFVEKFKNDTAEAVRELDDLLNNSQK